MSTLSIAAFLQDDWDADHSVAFDWVGQLGLVGTALFAGIFLFLLARGLLQARLYRAADALSDAERAELSTAIAAAEERTTGEVAIVVLGRSDRHPGAEWLAGAIAMLLGSALLAGWLPWDRPVWFFACQALLGAAGFLSARWLPGFKRAFISEDRADEMVREQALQEFYAHDLHRTRDATGVLLFVSLLERRVVVLGDTGIDAKLDASYWEATTAAILAGLKNGSLARGLSEGLGRCADVLAEHFPRGEDDRNEVHNHVVVRSV